MALGKLLGRGKAVPAAPAAAPAAKAAPSAGPGSLARLFSQGLRLPEEREEQLKKALDDGLNFYNEYNDSRLKLAFDSFDQEMRLALFELIFLLHENSPDLAQKAYTATRKDYSGGLQRLVETRENANLYVEGAPQGVRGINGLSSVFRNDFQTFIKQEYGRGITQRPDADCPFVCLQSIGSIGTVGHKSGASDLDLQVIYDLYEAPRDPREWSDAEFREALVLERNTWVRRLLKKYNLTPQQAQNPELKNKIRTKASGEVVKSYPALSKRLLGGGGQSGANGGGNVPSSVLLNELVALVKRHMRLTQAGAVREKEALLKEKVGRVQTYINEKYPQAEIYFFNCTVEKYRAGTYTSSLEFKESSGSAYELLLNYETLMPGIQFSPTVPSHFIFPQNVNNNATLYESLNNHASLNSLQLYGHIAQKLVDLGHTPDIEESYVLEHKGAVYWEAFKASSGNLPKATLNLLRYEMLLEKPLLKTIVQLVKRPHSMDSLIAPRPGKDAQVKERLHKEGAGMPGWVLLELEAEHPELLRDPWWLRYKALKIGFGEEKGVPNLDESERDLISRVIDFAFALHVRISDVFTKPGDTRKFESHREQVLLQFLEHAFPQGTEKRAAVDHIFSGEVMAINQFENDLRDHFRWSLQRARKRMAGFDVQAMRRNSQEVQLWHSFYQEHFEPKPNVVQKTILSHLKFPRGRLQVGYRPGEGWFFRSLQKESSVGKRFDTFGTLSHLPEVVTLIENVNFLFGLATCIINGYYGIVDQGKLKERRTALEFDGKFMRLDTELDNRSAFVRPDHVDRIMDRILEFFPYEKHHYMDHIREQRRVKKIFLFVNLWKFGRLSFLYRDNLSTWYCDEFDHPELLANGETLQKTPETFFHAEPLHETVDNFLREKSLYVNEPDLEIWVNPNSLETKHSGAQAELNEKFLADSFREVLLERHPQKGG